MVQVPLDFIMTEDRRGHAALGQDRNVCYCPSQVNVNCFPNRYGKKCICHINGYIPHTWGHSNLSSTNATSGKIIATGTPTWLGFQEFPVIHQDTCGFCRGQSGGLNEDMMEITTQAIFMSSRMTLIYDISSFQEAILVFIYCLARRGGKIQGPPGHSYSSSSYQTCLGTNAVVLPMTESIPITPSWLREIPTGWLWGPSGPTVNQRDYTEASASWVSIFTQILCPKVLDKSEYSLLPSEWLPR